MDNAAEADRLTADHPRARAAWYRLAAERGSVKQMCLLQRLRWWARAAGALLRAAWKDEFGPGAVR